MRRPGWRKSLPRSHDDRAGLCEIVSVSEVIGGRNLHAVEVAGGGGLEAQREVQYNRRTGRPGGYDAGASEVQRSVRRLQAIGTACWKSFLNVACGFIYQAERLARLVEEHPEQGVVAITNSQTQGLKVMPVARFRDDPGKGIGELIVGGHRGIRGAHRKRPRRAANRAARAAFARRRIARNQRANAGDRLTRALPVCEPALAAAAVLAPATQFVGPGGQTGRPLYQSPSMAASFET